jgi:hypothetical protein
VEEELRLVRPHTHDRALQEGRLRMPAQAPLKWLRRRLLLWLHKLLLRPLRLRCMWKDKQPSSRRRRTLRSRSVL